VPALPAVVAPVQATDCSAALAVPWQALAPGVWVWLPEAPGEVSVLNSGHVAPTTALVAGAEALVIDPGPSQRHGARVRQSLACRFQAEVRWIVNTHAHAENVLANAAFADWAVAGRLSIAASEPTRAAMQQRCPACLAGLTARAGAEAMAGTHIVEPTHTLLPGQTLTLGPLTLAVLPLEQGHTGGDLLLWNAQHRILWAGGLVYDGRIPELAQGRLDAWLAALDRLQAQGARHVVSAVVSSADGPGQAPAALGATRAYLQALRDGVLQAMHAGRQPQDAGVGVVALPAYRHWAGYAERHGFNVQRAWRELEPVWMEQGAPLLIPQAPSTEHIGG
jgi:glyoxylase-like metal-dependent hydrolase (beta-lactamase superfamily II)